jgi:hypothetical protein
VLENIEPQFEAQRVKAKLFFSGVFLSNAIGLPFALTPAAVESELPKKP